MADGSKRVEAGGPARALTVAAFRERPTAASALLLIHLAVAALVVGSVFQACVTIANIRRQIISLHDIVLIASSAAALLPAGAILFWGFKVITGIARLYRHIEGGNPQT